MKHTTEPDIKQSLKAFEERQNAQFEKIENFLKVIEERTETLEKEIKWEVKTEILTARHSLEKTVQNQTTVLNKDIKKELHERITYVGDLITKSFSNKIQNHEKRITKLEKSTLS